MTIIRGYNLLLSFILCLAALFALMSIGDGIDRYSEEPEDVWLSVFWTAILVPLAALCLVNGLFGGSTSLVWFKGFNLIAASLILMIMIIGQEDPIILVVAAIAVLGPLPFVFISQKERLR